MHVPGVAPGWRELAAVVALLLNTVGPAAALERGVSLGLFAEDAGWSYRPLLAEIAATGADHVELVVAYYQEHGRSSEIGAHPRFTAPPDALRQALRQARALGLKALVFPIVRLAHGAPGEWRGTLKPDDRAAWWASYRARLRELARLCEKERAGGLSVGSELSTLDGDEDRAEWVRLVGEVRQRYHGTLLYSGNWDRFRRVALYDLVDQIGLCGYFALAESAGAPIAELLRTWRDLRVELERFALLHRRPLVFTEIGYRSVRGATTAPWDEGREGPVDLEEQRRGYEAFRRVWQDAPLEILAGVYFWNFYGWGGPTSRAYTPRGKPALEEIKRWFSR
jgi:hypothetical protein